MLLHTTTVLLMPCPSSACRCFGRTHHILRQELSEVVQRTVCACLMDSCICHKLLRMAVLSNNITKFGSCHVLW